MDMLSTNAQAILLLTSHFQAGSSQARPLTIGEWNVLSAWLHQREVEPAVLLSSESEKLLSQWSHAKITRERLEGLLARSTALALAVEKWTSAGIWMMIRPDSAYPQRLKRRLGNQSPPMIFGVGNRSLLNQGGVGVVGSRNANDSDLQYAAQLGKRVAASGYSVISGGARGVDSSAMQGSIESAGTTVGVLSCDLLRNALAQKYRAGILDGNVALISTVHPDARFQPGNAMARNKFIYCLADAVIVVHSGKKGGTWAGAQENLKKNWVPLWIKRTDDLQAGNGDLERAGGKWLDSLPREPSDVESLFGQTALFPKIATPDLFDSSEKEKTMDVMDTEPEAIVDEQPKAENDTAEQAKDLPAASDDKPDSGRDHEDEAEKSDRSDPSELNAMSLYDFFIVKLTDLLADGQLLSPDEIQETLEIKKTQLQEWLKQAVQQRLVIRHERPRRYSLPSPQNGELFEESE